MSDNINTKLNYNYCIHNNQQYVTPETRDVNSGHIQVNNDSPIVYDNNCKLIYPDDVEIIEIGRSDSRFLYQKRNIGSSYTTSNLESCRIKGDLLRLNQQNKINVRKNQNPIINNIQPDNKYRCSTVLENPMEYQGTSNIIANLNNNSYDYEKICYYCGDNLAELEKNRIYNIRLTV